jgi:ADP-heptose:LPS heptosyltransferase
VRPQTIRLIDQWLGQPTAWALSAVRAVAKLVRPEDTTTPPTSILFLKMTEQGATVLAHAAIRQAIERVGREHVYFWVFDENRAILDLMGLVPRENVLTIDASSPWRFARDALRTLRQIRRLRIEATIDMEFFARASAILAYLAGARIRVGLHRYTFESPYRGDLLTHRVSYNPYLHTALHYLLLVEAAWADPAQVPLLKRPVPRVDLAPPQHEATDADRQAVRQLVPDTRTGGPLVLLNPNASDMLPLRRWPSARFVEVAKQLLADRPDVRVAFTGGRDEIAAADALTAEVGDSRCFSLAGRTTLPQLLALYDLADVLVTNDSGPGHFASLCDIHTVVLFGPETPLLYGPLGPKAHVLWSGIACSPCVSALNHRFSPCRDNVCMQSIPVEAVTEKVLALLSGTSGRRVELPILPPDLAESFELPRLALGREQPAE